MGREDSSAGIATAYAVVATDESEIRMMQDEPSGPSTRPSIRVAPIGFLDKPGAPDCSATTTTWEDDFFDGDDYVVAVFDLDYDRMVCYYSQLSWTAYIASLFIPNCLVLGLCCGVPCYINKNVHWAVRSQHVALTRDGVRFVQEQRQTLWGFPCTDSGTSITMVRTCRSMSQPLC